MRSLTTLPTPLLALLSTLALPLTLAQDGLIIETTLKVTCSNPTEKGNDIAVNYRGALTDGTVFDESYKRGKPITFQLGVGRVIQGWDQGLIGMCPGEKRILTIPPELGYGHRGAPPAIPPDSTLVFETELMEIFNVEQEHIETVTAASAAPSSFAPAAPSFVPLSSSLAPAAPSFVPLSSSIAPDETTTTTEQMFGIATAPAEPPSKPVQVQEDVNEDPGQKSEHKGNNKPPEPMEEVNEDGAERPAGDTSTAGLQNNPIKPTNDSPLNAMTEEAECRLLGPFALIVQGALGAVALLTLVYKRWRESPKRPWKIFFFDVSKQVLGSFLTHVLNLAMSMLGSVDMISSAKNAAISAASGDASGTNAAQEMPNPCSFYLLNLGIDTTLGIPVLYLLLKILHVAFTYTPLARPKESIKSGHYGNPPRTSWWLKQSIIYFIGLTGMKLFVYFLFAALPWLPWVGDWALRWTEGSEWLQVAFVMFIFPLAMNAIQYWVIDSFIMEKQTGGGAYERVQGGDDDEIDVEDEDADALGSVLDEDEVHVKNGGGLEPATVAVRSGQSSLEESDDGEEALDSRKRR